MRPVFWSGLLMVLVAVTFVPLARGQSGASAPSFTGKISAIEHKGKTSTIKVKGETEELAIDLSGKLALEISAVGDDGFLAPGLFARIDSTEINQRYFGSMISVFPQMEGKLPPTSAVKPPAQTGQSVNRQIVSGEIVKYTPPSEGDKYGHLELRKTARATLDVLIEPQHSLLVILSDPAELEMDLPVTATGRKSGDKLQAQRVVVTTSKKLKAEESLAKLTGKKKK